MSGISFGTVSGMIRHKVVRNAPINTAGFCGFKPSRGSRATGAVPSVKSGGAKKKSGQKKTVAPKNTVPKKPRLETRYVDSASVCASTMKLMLGDAKSRLDELFMHSTTLMERIRKYMHPYAKLAGHIRRDFHGEHTSNAWTKLWEILHGFLPDVLTLPRDGVLHHFDNGAFPGSFIVAMNHFCYTHEITHSWQASGLRATADNSALEDDYGLYAAYPDRWMMSETNDGNVCSADNLLDIAARVTPPDIYTSDIGMDVSDDPNMQESINLQAHYGQFLSGVLILRNGGMFVGKHYTLLEDMSFYIVELVSRLFEECWLVKPRCSRAANSETYLIGLRFRGLSDEVRAEILDVSRRWNPFDERARAAKNIVAQSVLGFMNEIIPRQIRVLNMFHIIGTRFRNAPDSRTVEEDIRKHCDNFIASIDGADTDQLCNYWLREYPIKILPADHCIAQKKAATHEP